MVVVSEYCVAHARTTFMTRMAMLGPHNISSFFHLMLASPVHGPRDLCMPVSYRPWNFMVYTSLTASTSMFTRLAQTKAHRSRLFRQHPTADKSRNMLLEMPRDGGRGDNARAHRHPPAMGQPLDREYLDTIAANFTSQAAAACSVPRPSSIDCVFASLRCLLWASLSKSNMHCRSSVMLTYLFVWGQRKSVG